MIVTKTKQARQTRRQIDSMLHMRYHDGASYRKQHVTFNSPFNITANPAWTFSCFFVWERGIGNSNGNDAIVNLYTKTELTGTNINGVGDKGITINLYRYATSGLFQITMDITNGSDLERYRSSFLFSHDTLYHLAITTTNSAAKTNYNFYINGIAVPEIYDIDKAFDPASIVANASDAIGMRTSFTGADSGFNGLISHACLFNRVLNQKEIHAIHQMGGILPDSTHANVQYHFPLTQPNGTTAYNAIEQYNYAKTTALAATHGSLVNYTTEEAGASLSSSNQVWKDFYEKTKNYLGHHFYAKNYYGTSVNHADFFNADPHVNWNVGSDDFEFYATFSCSSYTEMAMRPMYKPDTNWIYLSIYNTPGHDYIRLECSWNNQINVGQIHTVKPTSELLIPGKIHTLGFKKITNDAANWKIILDGKELDFTVVKNTLGSTILDSTGSIRFWPSTSSNFTLHAYESKFIVAGITRGHWQWNNKAGTWVKDLSGHSDIKIRFDNNEGSPKLYAGGGAWRENKSNLPTAINALIFNNSKSQYATVPNFVPTSEQGYTIVVGFALGSNRNFSDAWADHFFSKRVGGTATYIGHAGVFNTTDGNVIYLRDGNGLQTPYKINARLNALNLLVSTWRITGTTSYEWVMYLNGVQVHKVEYTDRALTAFSDVNSDLGIGVDLGFIGSRQLAAYLFYTGIAKGLITEKQVKELNNNLLYLQPSPQWNNLDWQLLVNFNRIIDTGTGYQLDDLSGKGHTITLHNYTATDVANSLTPINNLR